MGLKKMFCRDRVIQWTFFFSSRPVNKIILYFTIFFFGGGLGVTKRTESMGVIR